MSSMPGDLSTMSTDLVNSIITANAYKKYAKQLEQMQLTLPQEYGIAQGMLETQANVGLPGYEQQKADIQASVPTTLNQLRDYLDSSKIPELLSSIYSQSQGKMQQLDTQQSAAILGNQQNLAQYLSGVKAPAKTNLQQYNNELKAAADRARMQAKGAALQGASNVVSTATDTSLINSVIGAFLGTDMSSQIAGTAPEQGNAYFGQQANTGMYKQGDIPAGQTGMNLDYMTSIQPEQAQVTTGGGQSGLNIGSLISLLGLL